ncbi:MAG: hypothetical protein R3C15_08460 [Thermoleophilia bacterium]
MSTFVARIEPEGGRPRNGPLDTAAVALAVPVGVRGVRGDRRACERCRLPAATASPPPSPLAALPLSVGFVLAEAPVDRGEALERDAAPGTAAAFADTVASRRTSVPPWLAIPPPRPAGRLVARHDAARHGRPREVLDEDPTAAVAARGVPGDDAAELQPVAREDDHAAVAARLAAGERQAGEDERLVVHRRAAHDEDHGRPVRVDGQRRRARPGWSGRGRRAAARRRARSSPPIEKRITSAPERAFAVSIAAPERARAGRGAAGAVWSRGRRHRPRRRR